jgi:hypothetical protein
MTDYRWIADPPVADAGLAADLALAFASQAEAEDWLGTSFDDLRRAGAARVTLLADEHPVLGPMELAPANDPAERE